MEVSQVQYVSVGSSATSSTHNSQHHRLGVAHLTTTAAADLKATHDQFATKPTTEYGSGVGPTANTNEKKGQGAPESSINETIKILLDHHIVENRKLLNESWINLDKIADYCEANYLQVML